VFCTAFVSSSARSAPPQRSLMIIERLLRRIAKLVTALTVYTSNTICMCATLTITVHTYAPLKVINTYVRVITLFSRRSGSRLFVYRCFAFLIGYPSKFLYPRGILYVLRRHSDLDFCAEKPKQLQAQKSRYPIQFV